MIKLNYLDLDHIISTHTFPKYIEDIENLDLIEPQYYGFWCKNKCGLYAITFEGSIKESNKIIELHINNLAEGFVGSWNWALKKYYR